MQAGSLGLTGKWVVMLAACVTMGGVLYFGYGRMTGAGTNNEEASRAGDDEQIQRPRTAKRVVRNIVTRPATADRQYSPPTSRRKFSTRHAMEKNCFLQTYAVDHKGQLVICVGGNYMFLDAEENFIRMESDEAPAIQIYSPELELVSETVLPFTPTAINIDRVTHDIIVGGEGRLCLLDENGNALQTMTAPNVADMDAMLAETRAYLERQNRDLESSYQRQIERLSQKIDDLLSVGTTTDLSRRQTAQLEAFRVNRDRLQKNLDDLADEQKLDAQIRASIQEKLSMRSIAIAQDFVYVGVESLEEPTYEVWRVDRNLENPRKLLAHLNGCCGQLDIKSVNPSGVGPAEYANQFLVAENTHFRVMRFDNEGQRLDSFGHGSRDDPAGFGSCCNPMNMLPLQDASILTAESTVGHIKRYSIEGKLLAYIGRANLANACKNVALGFDSENDTYYILYQDEHAICVMRPLVPGG